MKQAEAEYNLLVLVGLGLGMYQAKRYNFKSITGFTKKVQLIASVFEKYDPAKVTTNDLLDTLEVEKRVRMTRFQRHWAVR